jgi:S1-C subfamily serine protease
MSEIEPTSPVSEVGSTQEAEVAAVEKRVSSAKVTKVLAKVWNNSHLWRVVTLALIVALGLQVSTTQPLKDFYTQTDPDTNGYVEPRNLGSIIEKLDASVVSIYCEINEDDSFQGTAWSFDYTDITNTGNSALMTNHHVIEDCISGGRLTIEDYWGETYDARLESYDEYNDLAIVSTSHKIPPLTLASYPPSGGYWVMAYGSADGYIGSIATGNIINIDEYGDLLITANLSGGNSGGPLVDNEGNVFGVNTWSYNNEKANTQYNISVSLDSFCDKLLACDGDTYWDWED